MTRSVEHLVRLFHRDREVLPLDLPRPDCRAVQSRWRDLLPRRCAAPIDQLATRNGGETETPDN